MDHVLMQILETTDLLDYEAALRELGVTTVSDVQYLTEDDLLDVGFNVRKARDLLSCCSSSAGSPRQGEVLMSAAAVRSTSSFGLMRRLAAPTYRKSCSKFWQAQLKGRPHKLIFVRHGESEANVNRTITEHVPDHMLHLTERGRSQALDAGVRLKDLIGENSVRFICSPYVRTKETLAGILRSWGSESVGVLYDVRIREQEFGNFDAANIKALHKEKREFGPFYYRFPEGESAADCYDRASSFLESMYRTWQDNEYHTHVIVGHGMMILVTLMRLFKYPVDDYEYFEALKNCELVVLERPPDDAKLSISYTWAPGEEKHYGGLRMKTRPAEDANPIWDGDPDAPLLVSGQRPPAVAC